MGMWGDILGGAVGLYDAYQGDKAKDDYADLVAQQEQQNYDTAKTNHDAYQQWLEGYNASKGGGGSKGPDHKFLAQLKALKQFKKKNKNARNKLKPYHNAGLAMLPIHQNLATQGAQGLGLLNGYLHSPQAMQKLQAPQTAMGVGQSIGKLPDHMLGAQK